MDLGPNRLAFVWALAGGNAFAQEDEELWVQRLDGSTGRLLDVGGAGECGFGGPYSFRLFGAPFLRRATVSYLAARGDCRLSESTYTRSGPSPRTRGERDSRSSTTPATIALVAARDSTGWWSIRAPREETPPDGSQADPCAEGLCRLVHSDTVELRPVKVSRAPRPPLEAPRT